LPKLLNSQWQLGHNAIRFSFEFITLIKVSPFKNGNHVYKYATCPIRKADTCLSVPLNVLPLNLDIISCPFLSVNPLLLMLPILR
jgi:hypothetical protein